MYMGHIIIIIIIIIIITTINYSYRAQNPTVAAQCTKNVGQVIHRYVLSDAPINMSMGHISMYYQMCLLICALGT